ncbi:MAG: response regulator [Nodosilinea sp.]
MRILVIEDHPLVAETLRQLLTRQGYAVDIAHQGRQGLEMLEAFNYHLLVLDLLLPDIHGVKLCQRIREMGQDLPILVVSGHNSVEQKTVALNVGADDYMIKPFSNDELIARVLALLRRGGHMHAPLLSWGPLQLDPGQHRVFYDRHEVTLAPKEYGLLELLLRHGEQVFSAQALLDQLWTAQEAPAEEAVRTHIKRLRQKLSALGAPVNFVETVHRVGYRLNPLLRNLILPSPAQRPEPTLPRILLVSTDPEAMAGIKPLLPTTRLQVVEVSPLSQFWLVLETYQPDLLLLYDDPSDGSGLQLCQALRDRPQWRGLPVIGVLPQPSIDLVHQAFAAGVNEVISPPIAGPELIARVFAQLRASGRLPVPNP